MMKEKLPIYLTQIKEIDWILQAIEMEIESLRQSIEDTFKNLHACTMTGGFEFWERDFAIYNIFGKSDEQRRLEIIGNVGALALSIKESMINIIKAYYPQSNVISKESADYLYLEIENQSGFCQKNKELLLKLKNSLTVNVSFGAMFISNMEGVCLGDSLGEIKMEYNYEL